jgi:hypothetical protein
MAQPKRARRPANVCILCGELGASDEDAVPTWVNDMFRRMGPGPYARIRDGVMTVPTPELRRLITRRPCERCNHWMGHVFEDVAAPVLKPMMEDAQPTTLMPAGQEVVAGWAVKTAMMLRLTNRSRAPYPEDEYRRLRDEDGRIGHHWSVWTGAQPHARKWPALPNLTATPIPPYPPTLAEHYDGWTYGIGHMVFQVLYRRGRHDRVLANGAEMAGLITRVWPVSLAPVAWPPRYVLASGDVQKLGLSIVNPVRLAS